MLLPTTLPAMVESRQASRKPPLQQVGEDPDPRFTLANERTFLAWVRTSLALLAAGLAVGELLRSRPEAQRLALGIPLVLLAAVLAFTSFGRWERTERALRLRTTLPYPAISRVVAVGVAVISVAAAVLLLLGR